MKAYELRPTGFPRVLRSAVFCLCWLVGNGFVQAQPPGIVVLKNGARIGPGVRGETATISKNSMQRGQGDTAGNSIIYVDDDLRFTYVNRSRVDLQSSVNTVNRPSEEIELPSKSDASRGEGALAIQGVAGVTDFNRHGRRIYSIETPRGRQDLLQGITKITPLYARVQTLRGPNAIAWDQRIATSTIRPDKLREILSHELDLKRSSEWMRLVRFYLQAERYAEARRVLTEALDKFPELDSQKELLIGLDQALADQMLREIELRRRSGQPELAGRLLQEFPLDPTGGASTETQLRVQDEIDKLKSTVKQISDVVQLLQQQVTQLPQADADLVRPVVEQIAKDISIESAERLSDYARFGNEASMALDQRVAFAIGGWYLGSGSGLDNFEVAKSVVRVSGLVREYLSDASSARREEILRLLAKEEGGQPDTIGKIIAAMTPPLSLPETLPDDPPGMFRLQSSPADGDATAGLSYVIQLPPEYTPYRRYPCIVALPGLGNSAEMEISWWSGAYLPDRGQRLGPATRHGYIVISPQWAAPDQLQYNYSEREHDRILRCVRDAMRRTSIDTDRVFITGHYDGGAAAWDLALSHPDLWAGAVMLSPSAEKYILSYGINAAYVPTYTVWGQFDGSKFMENLGRTVDDYLRSPKYDAIGVEYHGRPRDHFLEEIPRIIDWMELTSHRRERAPKDLDLVSARAGDRFYYWLELLDADPSTLVSPLQFDSKRPKIEASMQNGNVIRLSNYRGKQLWIWLRPDMVDFASPIEVIAKGTKKRYSVQADTRTLLEDTRTRADRQAPFYARLEYPPPK